MQEQRDDWNREPVMTSSLSFGKRDGDRLIPPDDLDSPQLISAVPGNLLAEEVAKDEEEEEEFEFTFAVKAPEAGSPITADEIFYDGRIRPVYPVFGRGLLLAEPGEEEKPKPTRGSLRSLFIEERETSIAASGSAEDEKAALKELSGIPPDTYCLWTPGASPSRCKKSGSTGSPFRWRFRDLMMGRSQSDRKETFIFFPAEKKAPVKEKGKNRKTNFVESPRRRRTLHTKMSSVPVAENDEGKDVAPALRSVGHAANEEEGGRRQPFLPYKQEEELLGFFANVKGLRRTYRPV